MKVALFMLFVVMDVVTAEDGKCVYLEDPGAGDHCCDAFCDSLMCPDPEFESMAACVTAKSDGTCKFEPNSSTATTTTVPVTTQPVTTQPVTTQPVTTTNVEPTDQLCRFSTCNTCVATEKGKNWNNLTDAECTAQCMDAGLAQWPCNTADLCACSDVKTTTTRGPVTTGPPSPDQALNQAWEQIHDKIKDADYTNTLFLSMKPTNNAQSCIGANKAQCRPSEVYQGQDFIAAAGQMIKFGVAGKKVYIGDYADENGQLKADWGPEIALMNLALFLGQCMEETILYDVCDENSWDRVHKVTGEPFDFKNMAWTDRNYLYPETNACGQLGQVYADYTCEADEEKYMCPRDTNMQLTATTRAEWWGAPPALKCGPNYSKPTTWDFGVPEAVNCGPNGTDACPNGAGDTDLSGCCWWGRGVIQTTGRCNVGKLNHFLGAGGKTDGLTTMYPDVDLCSNPNLLCEGPSDLKWMAGFYYWIDKVQVTADAIPAPYNVPAFDFEKEIQEAVSGKDSDSMAAKCSGLVNRGCASGTKCKAGEVDKLGDRKASTTLAVQEFLGSEWSRRLSDNFLFQ